MKDDKQIYKEVIQAVQYGYNAANNLHTAVLADRIRAALEQLEAGNVKEARGILENTLQELAANNAR